MGVGKTTLLKRLTVNKQLMPVNEPVEDNPFLNRLYNDPEKWSFTNQVWLELNHIKNIAQAKNTNNHKVIITDWGVPSVFSETMYQSKFMDEPEIETFRLVHELIPREIPDLIIYLYAKPNIIFERIQERKRECESNITQEYISILCTEYDKFILKLNSRMVIIENNGSLSELETKIIPIINRFIDGSKN